MRNEGDVDAEFAKSGKTLRRVLRPTPCTRHDGTAGCCGGVSRRQSNGLGAHAKSPTVQEVIAQAVGIRKEDVMCHVTLLGGGFGRK